MVKLVNCHLCKQPFVAHSPNAKYCPGCQKEAKRRNDAEKSKARRAGYASLRNEAKQKKEAVQKPRKQATAIKTVDEYCTGCVYLSRSGDGATNMCDYIGATLTRRPCPAGKGCTERKEG